MFLRKPKGVLHNDFEDTKKRVEHAKNIFVSQSENFYNNLLKIKYKWLLCKFLIVFIES